MEQDHFLDNLEADLLRIYLRLGQTKEFLKGAGQRVYEQHTIESALFMVEAVTVSVETLLNNVTNNYESYRTQAPTKPRKSRAKRQPSSEAV